MITWEVVEEIQEMLASGRMSSRQISKRTRVSRSTIDRIEMGERQSRRPDVVVDLEGDLGQENSTQADSRQGELKQGSDYGWHCGTPRRCPDCGGMVYMPCLLCDASLFRERRRGEHRKVNDSRRAPNRSDRPSHRGR